MPLQSPRFAPRPAKLAFVTSLNTAAAQPVSKPNPPLPLVSDAPWSWNIGTGLT
ncbi:uncharacterized protein UV8b_06010 [Ustilaginoidea virens]|uniref:Uncharacterized protein n=1 Tax=Ustilaginoidea virens TaxID=1159556 RepID=A0A8E5MJ68_USTVR|nr:uncharacterized protein UV8b_06010 [Ustilaginoidea virens]QUC21767.1 hypothetical protein UV8b_06010 [Ustilaginoidea virens]